MMCVFNILDEDAPEPKMSKCILCHIIFDVKKDFTHKAYFVVGGHVSKSPVNISFSRVIARDSVHHAS